jgi:hypothetical protein
MRHLSLALAALLTPSAAFADFATDYFGNAASAANLCYVRAYSDNHLARHPQQTVTHIALSPAAFAPEPPMRGLDVHVMVRGNDEQFSGAGYCDVEPDRLICGMEGDAGSFVLTGEKPGQVRLTVGAWGMSFEGESGFVTLEGDRGDDRVFLLNKAACG